MGPDQEPVGIGAQESFRAWRHGNPVRTIRRRCRPERGLRDAGVTLTQGVSCLRVDPARRLLMRPDRPAVAGAAFASGFDTLPSLDRPFLAQEGMPPSRFRALMLQQGPPAAAA